jgi:hypothetical protein
MLTNRSFGSWQACTLLAVLLGGSSTAARAATPKEPTTDLEQKAFFKPELYISSSHEPLDDLLPQLANHEAWEGFLARNQLAAADAKFEVYLDPRSGAVTNLIGPVPMIPGRGVGNQVTLAALGRRLGRVVKAVDAQVVVDAFLAFVRENATVLGIRPDQLGEPRATQISDDLWQVSAPQVVGGVPVRDARLASTLNSGNMVVLGTETWGNARIDVAPLVKPEQALELGFAFAGGRGAEDVIEREARLEVIPFSPSRYQAGEGFRGPVGKGYGHLLAWTFVFSRPPDVAQWEVMVDAKTGEVLAFQDINRYVKRRITGGVYPLTSTGICPTPATCGTMQSGSPMPFANTGLAAPNNFTNSGGIFDYTSGTVTTTLAGQFVRISDTCGAISQSGAGDVSLGGTNGQHDCTTGGGSAGNTPAARSGFYELNKLKEQARGWLPNNAWLRAQLTANMNINQTCNAFWNGSTVNFYRSGGGCRNTGEIAAVFDHEWGHGLDDNDAGGGLSNSSEGYADIAAIYRLQTSCVGHGFFQTAGGSCGQTADGTGNNANENQVGGSHCDLNCSGVRDADWDKHADHAPDTALGFVCGSCNTGSGPCGRQVHCAAAPTRQAAWDLVARDLVGAPFGLNSQSAFLVGNRLFYQGSGNVGSWHACTCGSSSSGCGATNGYMQWLAADDDNGNINDGTPHITALRAAFNRHGIGCSTPTAGNSGCAGGPATPPVLAASPGDFQASLSWNAVAGATRYWVMRTEGHAGCDLGKARIADITTTAFTDTEVANGRAYSYNVVAQGSSSSCFSSASNCVTVTPQASVTPDFSVSCSPSRLSVAQGASGTTTCTVTPSNGFNSAVGLSCANQPAGVSCGFNPASVTPPASSTLTVSVTGGAATGTSSFQVNGSSGSLTRSANLTLTVTAAGGDVFFDDFETDKGWVRNPNSTDTATTGLWERGDPEQTASGASVMQLGTTTSGVNNLVTGRLAGVSIGANDVDGGTTSIRSPLITLPAGTLTLRFSYYLAHLNNSTTADFFRVSIVSGGNTTQVFQELGAATTDVAAFTTPSINMSAFAGQTINILIQAADAGTASLVEAAVDDVRITAQ